MNNPPESRGKKEYKNTEFSVQAIGGMPEDTFDMLRAELSFGGTMVLRSDFTYFTLGENEHEKRTDEDMGRN